MNQGQQSMVDEIYERLFEEIVTGRLVSGTRLSVPALAKRMNVSRSPAREAIVRLAQAGLLDEIPRRGVTVARISIRQLVELYEIRELLEGLAATLAVEVSGRRLIWELEGILEEHKQKMQTANFQQNMEIDSKFHKAIRIASGNKELVKMLDSIQARVQLAMYTTWQHAGPLKAVEDHRHILEAIESGDPERAGKVARAHIRRLRLQLLQSIDEGE